MAKDFPPKNRPSLLKRFANQVPVGAAFLPDAIANAIPQLGYSVGKGILQDSESEVPQFPRYEDLGFPQDSLENGLRSLGVIQDYPAPQNAQEKVADNLGQGVGGFLAPGGLAIKGVGSVGAGISKNIAPLFAIGAQSFSQPYIEEAFPDNPMAQLLSNAGALVAGGYAGSKMKGMKIPSLSEMLEAPIDPEMQKIWQDDYMRTRMSPGFVDIYAPKGAPNYYPGTNGRATYLGNLADRTDPTPIRDLEYAAKLPNAPEPVIEKIQQIRDLPEDTRNFVKLSGENAVKDSSNKAVNNKIYVKDQGMPTTLTAKKNSDIKEWKKATSFSDDDYINTDQGSPYFDLDHGESINDWAHRKADYISVEQQDLLDQLNADKLWKAMQYGENPTVYAVKDQIKGIKAPAPYRAPLISDDDIDNYLNNMNLKNSKFDIFDSGISGKIKEIKPNYDIRQSISNQEALDDEIRKLIQILQKKK